MHELMAKPLDTERQYRTMARRNGIYDALEKQFWNHLPQRRGHYKRDLKTAVVMERAS